MGVFNPHMSKNTLHKQDKIARTISIGSELNRQVSECAERLNRTFSNVAQLALAEFVKNNQPWKK